MKAAQQQPRNSKGKPRGRPFPKGVSGNPGGRPKGSVSLAATIKRLLRAPDAERIVLAIITAAKAGDLAAIRLLLDRTDGPLAGPYAVVSAQAGVQVIERNATVEDNPLKHVSTEALEQIVKEAEEAAARPLAKLSKETLRNIIALADARGVGPERPEFAAIPEPVIVSAPAPKPEPTPEPVSAPPEQPQETEPASEPAAPPPAPEPERRGLRAGHDFIVDPFKQQEEDEPSRAGGVMSAEEFLNS